MQNNPLTDIARNGSADTLVAPKAINNDGWFSDQRITEDYHHAYRIETAQAGLNHDADTIQLVTNKDSLAHILASSIGQLPQPTSRWTEIPHQPRTIPHIQQQKEWIFPVILLAFILIGSVRVGAPKFITELFQAIVSETKWNNLSESLRQQNRKAALQLSIVYHLTLPLLVYEFLAHHQITIFNQAGGILYLMMLFAAILLYALRTTGYRILGFVFETRLQTIQFLQVSLIFTNITGLFLLPITLLIPYISPSYHGMMFRLGASLFIVLYIWHLSKGFKIILEGFLSIFYMFLYLCALEILPVLWLYKLFAG